MRSSTFASTLLRQQRQALRVKGPARRWNSTQSDAQKKAQDSLASAKAAAEKVFESAKKVLGPVGEKAGQLLGCEFRSVQSV